MVALKICRIIRKIIVQLTLVSGNIHHYITRKLLLTGLILGCQICFGAQKSERQPPISSAKLITVAVHASWIRNLQTIKSQEPSQLLENHITLQQVLTRPGQVGKNGQIISISLYY